MFSKCESPLTTGFSATCWQTLDSCLKHRAASTEGVRGTPFAIVVGAKGCSHWRRARDAMACAYRVGGRF
ncbi:MAG TPA: hypothetical protein PKD54_06160 [Pirellulaceae bacterium]|nr:hypothetical protein [Pirellulaceae bacterium]